MRIFIGCVSCSKFVFQYLLFTMILVTLSVVVTIGKPSVPPTMILYHKCISIQSSHSNMLIYLQKVN